MFHDDVLRRDIFMKLTPINDDVWLWAMAVLNGTKIKVPSAAHRQVIYVDYDKELLGATCLWKENLHNGKQDVQFYEVIKNYPGIVDKLIHEAAEFKPEISIILPITDSANLSAHLNNIFELDFPDFELILINCGSRVQIPALPTNFHVINYPGAAFADALNLGLEKSSGEYILFKDETSVLMQNSLDIAAGFVENSKADVLHFTGHVQLEDNNGRFILDDSPELNRDVPIFFNAPEQFRAAMWLQNKLSRRLDTKLFRKEFLMRHEIKFDGYLSEFLFRALIYAKNYLIVPQAFSIIR